MRRLRERRRHGLRVFPVPVSRGLIDAWVDAGLILDADDVEDIGQIVAEIVEEYGLLYCRQ